MINRNWLFLATLMLPLPTLANDIVGLFPYAAQSHYDTGELEMGWDSQIIGTRKGELDFNKHDDLNGKCDKKTCRISGKAVAAYSLPAFNNYLFTLPGFNKKNSSVEKECTNWNGQNIKLTDDKYKKIIAGGDCKISISNSGDVTIAESLTVNGSAVLTLQPGNYWLDSLDFSGGAKIMVAPAGEVNFYVKDNVNIAISSLGNAESKVNLYHYDDDDITLSGSLAWYGDVQTKGDVKISGSSKLYGSVQAESLVMSGSAEFYLTAGTYWLEDLELTGSAKFIPVGNNLTTLYVRDEVDLKGDVQLGKDGQPLLLFVYGDDDGDDDGEFDMEGSSRLYGHLYIQGDLDMGSSTKIYGAVNVVDLDMESSSLIDYRELKVLNTKTVDHYELHFNSCSEELMVKACADNLCSSLYQEKAKLHVKANGSNLVNFNDFFGTQSESLKSNKLNYPFTMTVQSGGNGGNMDPDADNPLICYVDGARSCTVNKPDGNADNGSFTLSIDTTYAADKGPIKFSGNCLASNATVETEFSFDSSVSGFTGPVTISWAGGSKDLNAGQKSVLTLPVSGATLSYPRADLLTLTARQMLPEGGYAGDAVTDQVAFVPASWKVKVQQGVNCGDNNGFKYNEHAASCTVLGAAGDSVNFSIAALDIKDNEISLDWLKQQSGLDDLITAHLEGGDDTTQSEIFGISNDLVLNAKKVGRLDISIKDWEAEYIPSGDKLLNTKKVDNVFIGRTVPARLLANAGSGKIKDGVVYRGKTIEYQENKQGEQQFPYFSIKACAFGQKDVDCKLPSYTGEFAVGLDLYASLTQELLGNGLVWQRQDDGTGEHIFRPDESFTVAKNDPEAEQSLHIPLSLNLTAHDQLGEITAATDFAGEDDTLRFGFITLMDTEVKTGEAGKMFSKLHYYGENLNTLKEDGLTDYTLSFGTLDAKLKDGNSLPDLSLSLNDDKVDVAPYSSEQKDIEVTIEGLPDWLKPERDGSLIDPEARLDILNQPRRRANDSTFNRREVIR